MDAMRYTWLLWFFSGVCLLLSQLNKAFWPLVFVGIAVFIFLSIYTKSQKEILAYSLIVGALKAGGGYMWIWEAFPIGWIQDYGLVTQVLFFGSFYLGIILFNGLGLVLVGYLLNRFCQKDIYLLILAPIYWVLGEVVGSLALSIWLLGDGSFINAYLSHGYVGIPLANLDILVPFAKLLGIYSLSYLAVLLSITIYLAIRNFKKYFWIPLGTVGVCVLVYLLFSYTYNDELDTHRVVVIDSQFDGVLSYSETARGVKSNIFKQALIKAAISNPDYILLPEDYVSLGLESNSVYENIKTAIPDFTGVVISMVAIPTDHGQVLRGMYHDFSNDHVYYKDKHFLAAQGEYLTYVYEGILKLLNLNQKLTDIKKVANFKLGTYIGDEIPDNFPLLMFCFNSSSALGVMIDPGFSSSRPFIVNPVSHNAFHQPDILWYQLGMLNKVQSIWTGKPVVVSANMSKSYMYKPNGQIDFGQELFTNNYYRLLEYRP